MVTKEGLLIGCCRACSSQSVVPPSLVTIYSLTVRVKMHITQDQTNSILSRFNDTFDLIDQDVFETMTPGISLIISFIFCKCFFECIAAVHALPKAYKGHYHHSINKILEDQSHWECMYFNSHTLKYFYFIFENLFHVPLC